TALTAADGALYDAVRPICPGRTVFRARALRLSTIGRLAIICFTCLAAVAAAGAATARELRDAVRAQAAVATAPASGPGSAPAPGRAPAVSPVSRSESLAPGADHQRQVEPGTPIRIRLEPAASFVEVTLTFEGAEVIASLQCEATLVGRARAPERSRGQLSL